MSITGTSPNIRVPGSGGGTGEQGPWWYVTDENIWTGLLTGPYDYAVFMIWGCGAPSYIAYGYTVTILGTGNVGGPASQRAFVAEVYWDSCSYMPADERWVQFLPYGTEDVQTYGIIVHRIVPLVLPGDEPYTYVSE
jgi:hypothetical protein